MSSNNPPCLLNGELPTVSPFFLFCFSRLVSIQLTALYLHNKQLHSLPKYHAHFCNNIHQSHLHFVPLCFCLLCMNSTSFAASPCRASVAFGSFWPIMTCSRLLRGEGSWQLSHRNEEQITRGESGDTFQPTGNGLS